MKYLSLYDTQISDTGLVRLKGLTKLTNLYLNHTLVTDAGHVHIKGLTNLEKLELRQTQVTDAGVAELEKAMPKGRVFGGGGR